MKFFALIVSFALLLSCQSWPAHAEEALKNGAAPAVAGALEDNQAIQKDAKDIPGHTKAIDAVPVPAPAKAAISPETEAIRLLAEAIKARSLDQEKDLAVAKAKIEAAEKYEASQQAQIDNFKSKDDADTKLWLRILASGIILLGGVIAYLWGKTGSFIRAGSAAAVGFVLGLGLFVAAAYWTLVVWIILGTVILAAIMALIALALHLWKHGSVATEKVDAMLGTAASTAAGASGVADMTTKEYWATLYAEHGKKVADKLWDDAKKMGIKLPE